MIVDTTGSIEITEIRDNRNRVMSKSQTDEVRDKLASGDYSLDLRNGIIYNLAGGNFLEIGKFDWSVTEMEYNFDFWDWDEDDD